MATYTGSDKRLKYLFENGGGGGSGTNVWVGTKAEYDEQALQIADGTIVLIVDDEEYAPNAMEALVDVDLTNLQNGQTLVYNSTSGKWENGAGGGGSDLGFYIDEQGYICQTITGE